MTLYIGKVSDDDLTVVIDQTTADTTTKRLSRESSPGIKDAVPFIEYGALSALDLSESVMQGPP